MRRSKYDSGFVGYDHDNYGILCSILIVAIIFNYFHFSCMQILNECNKAEQWLREKTQKQESLPKNTNPVLWSSEISEMTEDLDLYDSFTSILVLLSLKILFYFLKYHCTYLNHDTKYLYIHLGNNIYYFMFNFISHYRVIQIDACDLWASNI